MLFVGLTLQFSDRRLLAFYHKHSPNDSSGNGFVYELLQIEFQIEDHIEKTTAWNALEEWRELSSNSYMSFQFTARQQGHPHP